MDRSEALGVGMVGASGAFGRFIASALEHVPQLRLVAVAGRDLSRTAAAARELGAMHWYTDVDTLLRDPDVAIVAISTPPALHTPMAISAMRAGKAVFLEKPVATSYAQGRALLNAQRETAMPVVADFVMRYNLLFERLHAVVSRRLFGRLRHIDFTNYAGDEALPKDHWFWDKASSGGIFIEHGVHFFDVYGWLAVELPQRVSGNTMLRPGTIQEDQVLATVQYGNGVLGSFYHAFDKPSRLERQKGLLGFDRGYASVDGWTAVSLDLNGLIDENECRQLHDLGFRITTQEVFTGDERFAHGCGQDYNVTRRVHAKWEHTADKETVYRRAVSAELADLANVVRDPDYLTRITLWDSVLSTVVACAAADPAAAAGLEAELAWLESYRPASRELTPSVAPVA